MPPDYVARRAVTLLASGPTGGVMGATLAAAARRHRRLRRGRHGRHELRHLPRARRPARDQDRLELALPLLHRAADGRRAERRRRRRLDRARAPGRAARRPGVGRLGARARLLRPRRHAPDASPTPTRCSATCPSTASRAAACTSTSTRPRTAIREHVAEPLGIDVTDAAWGIERIVNANMANATRKVLAGHGADPRDLALIAYGGNGAVHAAAIARELGVGRIIVPKAAPAFSALGVLVADYVVDLVRSYVTPALAGRPRPRARPHDRSRCRRSTRSSSRPGSPRPTSSARCSRRCVTRARTST